MLWFEEKGTYCQCCMVWLISEAWIKCSITIVAFLLMLSRLSLSSILPAFLKALPHRMFLKFFRSLSTMSVAMTALIDNSRNRTTSVGAARIYLRRFEKRSLTKRFQASLKLLCSATLRISYRFAMAAPSLTSGALVTPSMQIEQR